MSEEDLVPWLRRLQAEWEAVERDASGDDCDMPDCVYKRAADEIERLREALEAIAEGAPRDPHRGLHPKRDAVAMWAIARAALQPGKADG